MIWDATTMILRLFLIDSQIIKKNNRLDPCMFIIKN